MSRQITLAARSQALFICELQPSQQPDADQVRAAVRRMVGTFGVRGCVARAAQEYGDHPETAVPRMRWALAAVSAAYLALDRAS
jgi:hypothetical protein